MASWMKKKGLRAAGLVLVLALAASGLCLWKLGQVSSHVQCLWLPPAQQQKQGSGEDPASTPVFTNGGLRAEREKAQLLTEQLEGAVDHTALFAVASPAAITTSEGGSAAARLEAIHQDVYALKTFTLISGRLFYPEELERGNRVILIDEQLAVALFQYAEPLERTVVIAEEEYRIVGILKGGKQVGDQQEYSLYVPFSAVEKSSLPLTALCFEASTIPGAGGWPAFTAAANAQLPGSTTINLNKEKANATMPLRLLGVVAGLLCLGALVGRLNRRLRAFGADYKSRLVNSYAGQLLPRLLGHGALFALAYAACAFALAQLFLLLVTPVYTFPEWVPAVLVEPRDIAAAFWNVWQGMAATVEVRSPQLLRIQFWARVMAWACGCAAGAAGVLWGKGRKAPGE